MIKIKKVNDIWYRNSFALGYWTFLKSDIDITIRIDNCDEDTGFEVARRHSQLRYYFKIIGELVIVDLAPSAISLKNIMNPLELMRDPVLCQFIQPSLPTQNEKIIFLHKFIINNWQHNKNNKISTRKLKFYFQVLNIVGKNYSFMELCNELGNLLNSSFDRKIYTLYENISHETGHYSQEIPAPYCALFFNKLYHTEFAITGQLSLYKKLLLLIINWEVWASISNKFFPTSSDFETHLQNLTVAAKKKLTS